MRFKTVMTVLLAACLMCVMLAACGNSNEDTKTTTIVTTVSTKVSKKTTKATTAKEAIEDVTHESPSIRILCGLIHLSISPLNVGLVGQVLDILLLI